MLTSLYGNQSEENTVLYLVFRMGLVLVSLVMGGVVITIQVKSL